MKKLINRVLGVVVAATLLMGSVMPNVAVMAAVDHSGDMEVSVSEKTECNYTITLKKPDGIEVDANAEYGAYQIFSGKVPDDSSVHRNPGDENEKLSITDIKWGNAFGIVNSNEWKENIVRFVIALGKAKTGKYSYAFTDFDGFEYGAIDGTPLVDNAGNLNSEYVKDSTVITDTTASDDLEQVNYDKLAVAVAEEIAKHDNREWLQAFSDILGGYTKMGGDDTKSYVHRYYCGDTYKYTIKVPAGYYMIIDRTKGTLGKDEAYSARMLFVASDVEQILKEDVPTLDKEIKRDDDKYYHTGVAGVGDDVSFRLTGTLPSNYDNYLGGYKYIFEDTPSDGLTLDETKANVTVTAEGLFKWNDDEKKWEWDDSGTVITIPVMYDASAAEGTSVDAHTHHLGSGGSKNNYIVTIDDNKLKIEFPCLKEIVVQDGGNKYRLGYSKADETDAGGAVTKFGSSRIYVEYSATVNEKAIISNGNINHAQLTYSNDPQAYDNTDTTKQKEATVYTFGLDIVKIDAASFLKNDDDSSESALSGAEFAIIREKPGVSGEYQIAKVYSKGPEDLLFGGEKYYSIESWTDLGKPESDSAADLQKLVDNYLTKNTGEEWFVKSDESGNINISGLDELVEYTMVETKTPKDSTDKDIYARIDPFKITLTAEKYGEEYTGKLAEAEVTNAVNKGESFSYKKYVQLIDPKAESSSGAGDAVSDTDGSANMLVANFKYVDLPSTGGIGIYPFYIIGGIVVAGSIILFALSRRKKTA